MGALEHPKPQESQRRRTLRHAFVVYAIIGVVAVAFAAAFVSGLSSYYQVAQKITDGFSYQGQTVAQTNVTGGSLAPLWSLGFVLPWLGVGGIVLTGVFSLFRLRRMMFSSSCVLGFGLFVAFVVVAVAVERINAEIVRAGTPVPTATSVGQLQQASDAMGGPCSDARMQSVALLSAHICAQQGQSSVDCSTASAMQQDLSSTCSQAKSAFSPTSAGAMGLAVALFLSYILTIGLCIYCQPTMIKDPTWTT